MDAFCLGDGFVYLELCYGVREGEDLLQVQVFLAEFRVSKLLEVFHEIDLILQLNLHNLIPQGLDQPKRNKHRRDFLLRDDEIPDPLGKLQGEIIEEKRNEPLKQPQLVHYINLFQLFIHLRDLLLQDDPKQLTVKLIKREAVLVQSYG